MTMNNTYTRGKTTTAMPVMNACCFATFSSTKFIFIKFGMQFPVYYVQNCY